MTALGLTPTPRAPKFDPQLYLPSMPPLWLLERAGRLYKAWRYRRKLANLLRYDDHLLEDMGHTRAELSMALALPLSQDPRPLLKAWKALRRQTG